MGAFEVDYNDNVMTVVHQTGCHHRPKGKGRQPLRAQTFPAAIVEAEYQGLEPSDRTFLGDAVGAPCTRDSA
jgi:hypothetical protein